MKEKKVAILQSNYIPWKGYFDLISQVDEFIFYDDMQYTRRDWRNRNQIKTANGLCWLTIPVNVKGKYFQKINETEVSNHGWINKHWQTIAQNYAKAPFFDQYKQTFAELYDKCYGLKRLVDINYMFIKTINKVLGIDTILRYSSDFELIDGKTERLVDLCKQTNATSYLSGPAAQNYIEAALFKNANIELKWMNYSGYPQYKQLHQSPFTHYVSVLDLIFNCETPQNLITTA